MDWKETKEQKLNELRNSLYMTQGTLKQMEERNVSKQQIEEVSSLIQNKMYEINFVESLNEKDFMIYLSLPFSKMSEIMPFQCSTWDKSKIFEEYEKLFKSVSSTFKNKEYVNSSEVTSLLSIGEPFRKNNFLVKIPEYFNISVKDIVSFEYNRTQKTILIKVREICEKKQIQKIVNFLNDESSNGVPYDEIVVQHLTPSYDVDYTHVFGGVILEDFGEEPLTYDVKHDADNLRYFTMIFKYMKDRIE